jgi:hypothetical protein
MILFKWRKSVQRALEAGRRKAHQRKSCRPSVEALEDRMVPSFSSLTGHPITAQEGTALTDFAVASFKTATPGDNFTATIEWGDGTASAGSVVSTGPSSFDVQGSHTYPDESSALIVMVTITDTTDGDQVRFPITANVSEADSLAVFETQNITSTEGQAFSGTVATFNDVGYQANMPADFKATIDWGDGTTSAGTVSNVAGFFTAGGMHTYADEGSFTVTATLTDDAPGSASASATITATVAEADTLSGTGAPVSVPEGQAFSGTAATFSDTNAANTASDFTATIDWGDGTTSPGTVSGGQGSFTVSGQHSYAADEGSFTATATLTDDAPGSAGASATAAVTVAEADTLSGTATAISATEGQAFSGTVATFSNSNMANPAGDFTATIAWGDGTTSAGTISGGQGSFTVSGSHTYAEEGSYAPTVTLTDDAPGTASATAAGTATVAEAGLSATASEPVIYTSEGRLVSGFVATFSDAGTPDAATAYSATIDWGDGTTSAGTVVSFNGAFAVQGEHTYADEGSFTVTVTVAETGVANGTASATQVALVREADFLTGSSASAVASEASPFAGQFTFSDPYTANTAGDFTATIDWGDGTTTPGTVSGGNGSFTVSGTHTYADEGTFTATATLTDDTPSTAFNTASLTVTGAEADTLSGTAAPVAATEGQAFSGTVATFSDSNTANTASDFTATIAWGDGTTTAGTVSGGNGSFTVGGTHTYAEDGSYAPVVTLTDDAPGTAGATATGSATVAEADLGLTANPVTATEGRDTGLVVVATFTDGGSPDAATAYRATIAWGDGTTTAGTVLGGGGSYVVAGSHTYADEGSFTTTVTLVETGVTNGTASATTTATVAEDDCLCGAGQVVVATEGVSFSGTVATFSNPGFPSNPAADFTAVIAWGDGTTSAGTVSGGNGSFTVSGSHTYADETPPPGVPFTVTLFDGPRQTQVVGRAFVLESPLPKGDPKRSHGTQAERWLSEVWQDLYGVPIDPASLRRWTRKLRHTSRAWVAESLVKPGVFVQLRDRLFGPGGGSLNRAQRLVGYCRHFLDREPDAASLGQLLAATHRDSRGPLDPEEDFVEVLLASAEYFNKVAP